MNKKPRFHLSNIKIKLRNINRLPVVLLHIGMPLLILNLISLTYAATILVTKSPFLAMHFLATALESTLLSFIILLGGCILFDLMEDRRKHL